jgi:hypothetical protein
MQPGDMLFHHCRVLESVAFRVVWPAPPTRALEPHDPSLPCDWSDSTHQRILLDSPKAWLAAEVGFWPLFLAVGGSDAICLQSGYAHDHSVRNVLFSYASLPPQGVFLDHVAWHSILAAVQCSDRNHSIPHVDETTRHAIFRPDLDKSAWLRLAAAEPGRVQAVAPSLDLRSAALVSCHDVDARTSLVDLGFSTDQVRVWVPVPPWEWAPDEVRRRA